MPSRSLLHSSRLNRARQLVLWACILCLAQTAWPQTVAGVPKLKLSTTEWDFGERWSGEPAKTTITMTNVGDAPLDITRIKTGCDCTAARVEKNALQPGEVQEIKVSYNTLKRTHDVSEKIRIFTNDPSNPIATIVVKGRVKPLLDTGSRGLVSFGVLGRDDAITKSLDIKCVYTDPLDLGLKVTDADHVAVKLEPIEKGKRYRLTISTEPPLPDGTVAAKIALLTGLDFRPEVLINASGFVSPRVTVMPDLIAVPPTLDKSLFRLIQLRYRRDNPVRITHITTSNPDIKTEVMDDTPRSSLTSPDYAEVRIRVTVPPLGDTAKIDDTVTIATDDDEYPEFTVHIRPLTARGKHPRARAQPESQPHGPD